MSIGMDTELDAGDAPTPQQDTEPAKDYPDYLASLKLVGSFIQGNRLRLSIATLFATLSVALELAPIWAIYQLIIATIDGSITSTAVMQYGLFSLFSVLVGFTMLGLSLGQAHIVAFNALYHLRKQMALYMSRLSLGYFANKKSGDAKKLIIDEPEKLELIIAHGVPEGVSALSMWLAVSVWLFAIDWRMALVAILVTPISFACLITAMMQGGKFANAYQQTSLTMNASIVDYLAGMPVVKIFNRSGDSLRQTSEAVKAYTDTEKKWAKAYIPFGGTFFSLVLANIVLILPAGAYLLAQGAITLETLILFVILGANYSQPLLKLFNQFHQLAHISMGSMMIDELLNTPVQHDSQQHRVLDGHGIHFNHVSFSYGEVDVLHNISFTAKANTITALVGPSGSGKSTLASLIPRFWDVQHGQVCIGGHDVANMSLNQLMDTVAFVFQDTFLFSDSIAENIRFGCPNATHEQIHAAAKAAQAHEFITQLPMGYQTILGSQGTHLSGGERQRIAIARAILKNAPVIVLDEATAFADPDNEAAIQRAIHTLAKGKTVIMIAHRLHTIANADQIIVLDRGHIAESGQHQQLLEKHGLYARMWDDYRAAKKVVLHHQQPLSEGETA